MEVSTAPFGHLKPRGLDRLVISLTRSMPDTWIGLRLAMALRRITTRRLKKGGLDVDNFGLKLRLYPIGNNCEKGALFTPQMYESLERQVLARLVKEALGRKGAFSFIDIGANVGLFSLIVAKLADGKSRALAIEPQPGINDRLLFNLSLNPDLDIRPLKIALAERDGEVDLFIDPRDRGGTRIGGRGEAESVRVQARLLSHVLAEEGFDGADVMKIDIEGAEDLVLEPFLRDAADDVLPRAVLIEDSRATWTRDVFAMLRARGYRQGERSRQNVFFYRG